MILQIKNSVISLSTHLLQFSFLIKFIQMTKGDCYKRIKINIIVKGKWEYKRLQNF